MTPTKRLQTCWSIEIRKSLTVCPAESGIAINIPEYLSTMKRNKSRISFMASELETHFVSIELPMVTTYGTKCVNVFTLKRWSLKKFFM